MRTVTRADILSWGPCDDYPDRLPDLLPGPKSRRWTALEIVKAGKAGGVPPADILWALLRQEFFSDNELRELACRFAHFALMERRRAEEEPHPDSWRAIRVARRFIRGQATASELASAYSAAYASAYSAAAYAAYAYSATYAASPSPYTYSAAYAAAYAAASPPAASSPPASVAHGQQLSCVVRLLKAQS